MKDIQELISKGKTRPRKCTICGKFIKGHNFYLSTEDWMGQKFDTKVCICSVCMETLNEMLQQEVAKEHAKVKSITKEYEDKEAKLKESMMK